MNTHFTKTAPLFSEIGVLALVPHRWNDLWQPSHHVLARLAKYFYVVWVNPAYLWKEGVGSWKRNFEVRRCEPAPPGFTLYSPDRWLPTVCSPTWLASLTFQARLRRAQGLLRRHGCKKIVLYLWRPEFASALSSIKFDLSCYHIDDEYSFSSDETPIDPTEVALIKAVDQVFIHSPALLEKKGNINPATSFVPNGVDYKAYAEQVDPPLDLRHVPRPRIGYTGHLKKQLDWPLILELCTERPDWSFVFVGSPNPNHPEILPLLEVLQRRQNTYFLGEKSVRELTRYPQHFDVCVMPYKADGYTKYIYPLKLHEYLASGRPVVGTRIRSLEEFEGIVTLASTRWEWSRAIAAGLDPETSSEERRAARQAIAKQHDWDLLVRGIAEAITRGLGRPFSDRALETHADAEKTRLAARTAQA
jgi:glycosyltransferase involved in cell wall biosynthesis